MKTNLKNVIATIVATVSIGSIGGAVFAAKMSNEGEKYNQYCQEIISNEANLVNKSDINLKCGEYTISERIEWETEVETATTRESFIGKTYLNINKLTCDNSTAKLNVLINGIYHTNTDYLINITSNNKCLNKNVKHLYAGVETDIVLSDVDLDSKINITICENKDGKELVNKTLELDLSKIISQQNNEIATVSYIILEIEDKNSNELQYKEKKITDKQQIDSFMEIINNSTQYQETTFIADFGDITSCATI